MTYQIEVQGATGLLSSVVREMRAAGLRPSGDSFISSAALLEREANLAIAACMLVLASRGVSLEALKVHGGR